MRAKAIEEKTHTHTYKYTQKINYNILIIIDLNPCLSLVAPFELLGVGSVQMGRKFCRCNWFEEEKTRLVGREDRRKASMMGFSGDKCTVLAFRPTKNSALRGQKIWILCPGAL